MTDGIRGPLVAGLFAVAGALGGAGITGWSQVQLAKQKFNSDLVLKALESAEPAQRLESLRLLVETNLLQDPDIQKGVRDYAKARESKPETIPQVIPGQTPALAAPVVADARVFLLAGTEQKRLLFASYKSELEGAGYRVLDSRVLNDQGRPKEPEIRYFHVEDTRQAEAIAEFVRFKLDDKTVIAKMYRDASARPGYIEVWFGK